ncbi:MAG: hypothetical protein ACRED5_10875 [Propylenella sp.]
MPDYASILRRSITALPDPNPEMREAVYARARAALARQLTAVDPPLSSREIETQHQELEDAVVRLEAEFAPQPAPPPRYEPPKDEFLFTTPPSPSTQRQAPPPRVRETAAAEDADYGAEDEEDEDEDFGEDEDRASRTPALIGLLVVVLVVLGIGGYAYSQRDSVFALFGFGSEVEEPSPAQVVAQDGAADEIAKRNDRLGNGTEPPPAEEPAPADTVMIVPPEEPTLPETTTSLGPQAGEETTTLAPPTDVDTSLVGQRAIYYYQGAEGQSGEAHEGTATWANITKDGNPAIRATLRIPDRKVEATVTIYKNYDPSLPASHLVEIQFSGALSESPIQRVPALVMKQTEQARGQPLAGAAVPVTNDLFWIALADDAEQVSRNIQLLREGSWFDVPILYNDQTRALLTFEKGIPGDKVFEAVMASWTP